MTDFDKNKPRSLYPLLLHLRGIKSMREAIRFVKIIRRRLVTNRVNKRMLATDLIGSEKQRAKPATVIGDKVLYLAHMSLPYDSAGYATRTHSLLSNVSEDKYDAFTRLGYPFDIDKSYTKFKKIHGEQIQETFSSINYEGVCYKKILDGDNDQLTLNRAKYLKRYADQIVKKIDAGQYKVIHASSDYRNGISAGIASKRTGVPFIYEVRGLWHITRASKDKNFRNSIDFKIAQKMELDTCRYASHVMVLTEGLKQWLVAKGIDAKKISVLPNGISFQRFASRSLHSQESTNQVPVIGYVGSFVKYEGLLQLVDVAEILYKKGLEFKLLLVGDGEDLTLLKQKVNDKGLEKLFELPGRVDFNAVQEYYDRIDICVYPRLPMEVCELVSPLKPFEAMYLKKAILASDVAAQKEFIDEGYNGLLHRKGDVMSLANQLETLIVDKELCERLGKNAHRWVLANRQWENIIKKLTAVYDRY